MIIYSYLRKILSDGRYAVENSNKLDELGNPIYLNDVIKNAFPEFAKLSCSGSVLELYFNEELSDLELLQVDELVFNYQEE